MRMESGQLVILGIESFVRMIETRFSVAISHLGISPLFCAQSRMEPKMTKVQKYHRDFRR